MPGNIFTTHYLLLKYIVTASNDTTAQIWDLSGKKLATLKHLEKVGKVYRANFSPDGKYIVTASADKTAQIWDLSGKKLITLAHEHQVNRASFSPDSKRIVTISFDEYTYEGSYTITLWDLLGNKIGSPLKLQGGVKVIDAVFSPKGLIIATTSEEGTVQVLDCLKISLIKLFLKEVIAKYFGLLLALMER